MFIYLQINRQRSAKQKMRIANGHEPAAAAQRHQSIDKRTFKQHLSVV
jgi:hypothetical protein